MRSTGITPAVVAAIEDLRRGSETIDATYASDVVAAARQIEWRLFAPPGELQAAERTLSELTEFPAPHRVLPMRLGNVLRSQEDRLVQAGYELEGFVMRRYATVPARLLAQHDDFRTRLEMYCTFVPVFLVLAVLSAALLTWPGAQLVVAATFTVVLAALGLLSYRAAIASAHGYCTVLAAMATYPEGVPLAT